jgi:hypothetical protein
MPALALHEVFKLHNSVAKFRFHFLVFIHNVASFAAKTMPPKMRQQQSTGALPMRWKNLGL